MCQDPELYCMIPADVECNLRIMKAHRRTLTGAGEAACDRGRAKVQLEQVKQQGTCLNSLRKYD